MMSCTVRCDIIHTSDSRTLAARGAFHGERARGCGAASPREYQSNGTAGRASSKYGGIRRKRALRPAWPRLNPRDVRVNRQRPGRFGDNVAYDERDMRRVARAPHGRRRR